MKTNTSYNYSEIINSILSGKIDTLYIISSRTYDDDKDHTGDLKWYNEPYFAGTTLEEAQEAMNDAKTDAEADVEEYQYITLAANKISVSPEDLADYDEECDDAELEIESIVDEHKEGAEDIDLPLGSWDIQDVYFQYESMENGILLYWNWDRYVGYARTFRRLEYCVEKKTTLSCSPTDSAFREECEMLVSPAEVQACHTASELRELMNDRMREMGQWKSYSKDHYEEIDEFLSDCYRYRYNLPKNDLYNNIDE